MRFRLFDCKKKKLYSFLSVLVIALIFYNSTRTGDESTKLSDFAALVISKILVFISGKAAPNWLKDYLYTDFLEHIRIAAHFTEFFLLGLFVSLYFKRLNFDFIMRLGFVILFGFLIALIDETIQYFTPDRAFQFLDIATDMLGYLLAVNIIFLMNPTRKEHG